MGSRNLLTGKIRKHQNFNFSGRNFADGRGILQANVSIQNIGNHFFSAPIIDMGRSGVIIFPIYVRGGNSEISVFRGNFVDFELRKCASKTIVPKSICLYIS